MKHLLAFLAICFVLVSVFSCEPAEEQLTRQPKVSLAFSADTVLFDTVFVKTGSVTKRLLVYNNNKNAVEIDEIKLGKLDASAYRIIINGLETPRTQKIRIRGGDSLYVLVKVFIQPNSNNAPFLVQDSVTFSLNQTVQDVKLVAYGQNAYFHRREELTGNTVWLADKAHVIYDHVTVKTGSTLTLAKGARIYANRGAYVYVDGTLVVDGTAEERVAFAGHRLEAVYKDTPGLWGGIRFRAASRGNIIRYADIKNAEVGIGAENPDQDPTTYDIRLEQCTIQNMLRAGIVSYSADVQAINTLIANCGEYAVAGLGGGTYEFIYCTLANYTPDFRRNTPAFFFTDRHPGATGQNQDYRIKINMLNSIIWSGKRNGSLPEEIGFRSEAGLPLDTVFRHNILQTQAYQKQLNKSNIFNEDPKFKRSVPPFDFSLDTLSVANGAALPLPGIKFDLKKVARDEVKPDIGAYERIRP